MRARLCIALLLVTPAAIFAQGRGAPCLRAVVEGEVKAGESFERVFAPGLKFLLEPIASGWIVRVLPASGAREAHDYAELATPPYRSMTPLAISTDYSFRAQDVIGWNPRRFRYAASAAEFRSMMSLYEPALAGNAAAVTALAERAARQPEAVLTMEDARLAPGTNDQAKMASMVSLHLQTTPHRQEASRASPLGAVTWVRFRAEFDLREGVHAVRGVKEQKIFCVAQTTTKPPSASEKKNPELNK